MINVDEHNRILATQRRTSYPQDDAGMPDQGVIGPGQSACGRPKCNAGSESIHLPLSRRSAWDAMFNSALVYESAVLKQHVNLVVWHSLGDSGGISGSKRLPSSWIIHWRRGSEDIPKNQLVGVHFCGSCPNVNSNRGRNAHLAERTTNTSGLMECSGK